jgi:cardiolipin synthase
MFVAGVCVFWVASVSDFFDGYIARRWKAESKLGCLLDPVADKVLTLCSYIPLMKEFPKLFGLVILRDVCIVVMVCIGKLVCLNLAISPLIVSKINTGFVLLFPFLWLCQKGWQWDTTILRILSGVIVVTTVLSSIGYVLVLGKAIHAKMTCDTKPHS